MGMLLAVAALLATPDFERVEYLHPNLVTDLGVGLWAQPLPMDYDGDGDNDLLLATADVPYNGLYFFENTSGDRDFPIFAPAVRLGPAPHNLTCSYVDGEVQVLTPGKRYPDFRNSALERPVSIPFEPAFHLGRAKQWKYVDYDGDGRQDLIIGTSDWREYGWDNAFDETGAWQNGPLHGHVYVMRNGGTGKAPKYEAPFRVQAGGRDLDVYGCPSPNFADFDGDGDLDLVCGEFLDRITYFQNTGSRTAPAYTAGRFLEHEGTIIRMELQMLQVVAFDWNGDGNVDLVVGQEDGRVALLEHSGFVGAGMPAFRPPRFFQQRAEFLKVGALATPSSVDWDGDGDGDLIAGDTAGYISLVENLDGGDPPQWAPPRRLAAGGKTIRIQAGANGSIQGPAEAKWGYTVLTAADWNGDGLPDIAANSLWGKVHWYENLGPRNAPTLAAAAPIDVAWESPAPKPAWNWWPPEGNELVTQWRTTPFVTDLDSNGLSDLVMLDHEGYLAFFQRQRSEDGLILLPGQRIFLDESGASLRLNEREAGKSGRRKFVLCDWNQDGRIDILINSENIDWLRNVGTDEAPYVFKNEGEVARRRLAGHTTCPTVVDWDRNGVPDLLVGAEDGFFYHLKNPHDAAARN